MAICVIKTNKQLGMELVLTPERYNPRRRMNNCKEETVILSDLITISNEIVTTKQGKGMKILQINTSDAMGGYLNTNAETTNEINSNKKIIKKGDVIISRLRPYLKQVAYVDVDQEKMGVPIVVSTEFYVLRSRGKDSIAYLVPFLLSEAVQTVFINSVEGSQHPRFKEEDILNLRIPVSIYRNRDDISERVKKAIISYRAYEEVLKNEVMDMDKVL